MRGRGRAAGDPVPCPSDSGRGARQLCGMTASPGVPPRPDGALARVVRRAAGAAAARPRTAIALWLVLVAGCVLAGGMAGTRSLTESEAGVGESQRADERLAAAVLIEVTIVRAVALPAAIARLGEKGWRVRRRRAPRPVAAEARA